MDNIKIEIPNWEKYNARNDIKSPTWFRFQNNFFSSEKPFILNDFEKILYVFLLCERSKKGDDKPFSFAKNVAAAVLRKKPSDITKALSKIEQLQLVKVHTYGHVRTRTDMYATDIQTNIQTDIVKMNFDLESAYKKYPSNGGKKLGLEKLKPKIKTQEDFDNLLIGIDLYKKELEMESWKKPKNFSTFVNQESWKEYLEENEGEIISSYQNAVNHLKEADKKMEGINYFEGLFDDSE